MGNPQEETVGVSVIIPVHNKETYIRKCIESVLGQTYPKIEVLVVDDASADDSVSLAQHYEQRYSNVRLLVNDRNQGVSRSRNLGAEKAAYKYLCFLDADDFFVSSNAIEDMLAIARENTCAFGRFVLADKDGAIRETSTPTVKGFEAKGSSIAKIIGEWNQMGFPRNYLVYKETFLKVGGFDLPFNYNEDVHLVAKLLANGVSFAFLDTIVSAYRLTGEGLSKTNSGLRKQANRFIRNEFWPTMSFSNRCAYRLYHLHKTARLFRFSFSAKIRSLFSTKKKAKG